VRRYSITLMLDYVSFIGFVEEDERSRYYQQAWVLATASMVEGWGLVTPDSGNHFPREPSNGPRGSAGTKLPGSCFSCSRKPSTA